MQVTVDSKVSFAGRIWSVKDFAEKFESTEEQAIGALQQLIDLGKAVLIDETDLQTRKEEKILQQALKELEIMHTADMYDAEDMQVKQFNQAVKNANHLRHKGYYLIFATMTQAEEFQVWVTNTLFLESTIEVLNTQYGRQYKLNVFDITDQQIMAMDRKYTVENAINKTVGVVDKTLSSVANGADYTSQKVLAPLVQAGAKTGAKIVGTTAKIGVKTASTLVSSLFQGARECREDLRYDPDVARARRELTQTKNEITRAINNHKVNGMGTHGGYL